MIISRIKYRLALGWKTFAFTLGMGNYLLKDRYGERILVFHGVDHSGGTRYNSRFVAKDDFEKLMVFIRSNYNIVSLDDFYARKFKENTLNIAITFDDGYRNNCELAAPILEKLDIPATFFITATDREFLWGDFLDLVTFHSAKTEILFEGNRYVRNRRNEFAYRGTTLKNRCKQIEFARIEPLFELFDDDWQRIKDDLKVYWELMSDTQLESMAQNPLFSIGAHGLTHANLIAIGFEDAVAEIVQSKEKLEKIIGRPIDGFAFPFGAYRQDLIAFCEHSGYSKILLVDYNTGSGKSSRSLANRFVVNPYLQQKHLVASLLKGSYF